MPSWVLGTQAPPANVYPHFLQVHMPTLSLLSLPGVRHLGHLWGVLILLSINATLFLSVEPYLAPNLPALPTSLVLPTSEHLFPLSASPVKRLVPVRGPSFKSSAPCLNWPTMVEVRALRVRIIGIVQGVGFRPFVHRLATGLGLRGYVKNLGGSEVEVWVEGDGDSLREFLTRLERERPPPALIEGMEVEEVRPVGYDRFTIAPSARSVEAYSMIPPDLGVCGTAWRRSSTPRTGATGTPSTPAPGAVPGSP